MLHAGPRIAGSGGGGGGGGIPEAPGDGQIYGRDGLAGSWQPVLPLIGGSMTGGIDIEGGSLWASDGIGTNGTISAYSGRILSANNGANPSFSLTDYARSSAGMYLGGTGVLSFGEMDAAGSPLFRWAGLTGDGSGNSSLSIGTGGAVMTGQADGTANISSNGGGLSISPVGDVAMVRYGDGAGSMFFGPNIQFYAPPGGALQIYGPGGHWTYGADGSLTLVQDPTAALHAATKQYVDAHAGGGGTAIVTVNVADHGATGNGSTDDTAALQAAADAIPATGGWLFFPAASVAYLTSRAVTLKSGTMLSGCGMASLMRAASGFIHDTTWGSTCFFNSAGGAYNGNTIVAHDISVESMAFDGSAFANPGQFHAIRFGQVRNTRVENCYFNNVGDGAAHIGCIDTVTRGNTGDNIWNALADHWGGTSNALVDGNIATAAPGATGGYLILFNAQDTENTAAFVATSFRCVNNKLKGASQAAIFISPLARGETSYCIVQNNEVDGTGGASGQSGIMIQGNTGRDYDISHNIIKNIMGGLPIGGLGNVNTIIAFNTIQNCDPGSALVFIEVSGTNARVYGNVMEGGTCLSLIYAHGPTPVIAYNTGTGNTGVRVQTSGATNPLVIDYEHDNGDYSMTAPAVAINSNLTVQGIINTAELFAGPGGLGMYAGSGVNYLKMEANGFFQVDTATHTMSYQSNSGHYLYLDDANNTFGTDAVFVAENNVIIDGVTTMNSELNVFGTIYGQNGRIVVRGPGNTPTMNLWDTTNGIAAGMALTPDNNLHFGDIDGNGVFLTSRATFDSAGNTTTRGNITSGGNLTAPGNVTGAYIHSTGNVQADGSLTASGDVHVTGSVGFGTSGSYLATSSGNGVLNWSADGWRMWWNATNGDTNFANPSSVNLITMTGGGNVILRGQGIEYAAYTTHVFAFTWDGANIFAVVDGTGMPIVMRDQLDDEISRLTERLAAIEARL